MRAEQDPQPARRSNGRPDDDRDVRDEHDLRRASTATSMTPTGSADPASGPNGTTTVRVNSQTATIARLR